jgi:hypothetical protein
MAPPAIRDPSKCRFNLWQRGFGPQVHVSNLGVGLDLILRQGVGHLMPAKLVSRRQVFDCVLFPVRHHGLLQFLRPRDKKKLTIAVNVHLFDMG